MSYPDLYPSGSQPTGREPAITLARDTIAVITEIADTINVITEWADDEIAGGKPPKWVIRELLISLRLIAMAARGKDITP